ncbi:hypothetical protein LguiA_017230 [Lonicera macranthoides]
MVYQHLDMAKSVNNSTDQGLKLKQVNQLHRSRKSANSPHPICDQSRSAAIDVVIMIAVIGACGYLIYPYVILLSYKFLEITGLIIEVMKEEIIDAPFIYGCLGLSLFCAVVAVLGITVCTSRKCGKPGCKGLHKAAEFDIQLETEECVKNSAGICSKDGLKKGLFELPRDHHRELEAELKKMAPPNGRAVLVFKARCGCSVGRMEVPGPKKIRKVKK